MPLKGSVINHSAFPVYFAVCMTLFFSLPFFIFFLAAWHVLQCWGNAKQRITLEQPKSVIKQHRLISMKFLSEVNWKSLTHWWTWIFFRILQCINIIDRAINSLLFSCTIWFSHCTAECQYILISLEFGCWNGPAKISVLLFRKFG